MERERRSPRLVTLNSKVNSAWNVKDICVQGEKSQKVENKAKSGFPVFLRSWKDLLEMLPWFSGLLCELVLVTGVVTLRVNEFKGCNSESRGSLQHGPGLQMNIKARGGLHGAVQKTHDKRWMGQTCRQENSLVRCEEEWQHREPRQQVRASFGDTVLGNSSDKNPCQAPGCWLEKRAEYSRQSRGFEAD